MGKMSRRRVKAKCVKTYVGRGYKTPTSSERYAYHWMLGAA